MESKDQNAAASRTLSQLADRFVKRAVGEVLTAGRFALWEWNPRQDWLTAKNLAVMLGYAPKFPLRKSGDFIALVNPEDREEAEHIFAQAAQGIIPKPSVLRVRAADNGVRWCMVHAEIVHDAASKPMRLIGAFVDVTDQFTASPAAGEVPDASEQRFLRAFQASPDWVVISRFEDGRLIEVNRSFELLSGYRAEEVIGKTTLEIGLWIDERARDEWTARIADTGSAREVEIQLHMRSGEVRVFQASAERIRIREEDCLVTICRDITARKSHEALLFNIAQGVAAETGESFFRSLVDHLAAALDADFAFIGELPPEDPSRVRTIAVVKDRLAAENFEYDLAPSPCAQIIGRGLCAFPNGVAQRFPDDHFLAKNGIEAYVGSLLIDSSNRPLGLIAVMFRSPLENTQLAESMLRIFAMRASAELERQRQHAFLEHQAMHDSLTGLPNRLLLKRRIESWHRDPAHEHGRSALLLIDLDRFKEINDTLGHHVGDVMLRTLAARLRDALESGNEAMVCRLGGDEFAVWLAGIERREDAERIARTILEVIHAPFDVESTRLEISASIGIALCPDHSADASDLLRYADVAMYAAKRLTSGWTVYESALDPHSPRRLAMMTDLGEAIRKNQLVLHFQPRVSISQQKLVGMEALVRWQHPTLGLVPPAQFVPLAEMSESIRPLTWWVLEAALAQQNLWVKQGLPLRVAVNFSARHLMDDAYPGQIKRLLARYGTDPDAIELEITESAIIADPGRAMNILTRIHAMGVRLSIDDFGTGYSSLAYLRRLPLHALKIDQSFVRQMTRSVHDTIIVRSTIALAHNLRLTVIAEGVEDAATLDQLASYHCDEAQGYHVARPMPPEDLTQWLRSNGVWSV
jgi:diguanylate cyclase (GGDEF)-like protein/PAS domain S-box-containing protein